MAATLLCSIPNCGKPACNKRGWCWAHYTRYIRYGDPLKCKRETPRPIVKDSKCTVDGCQKPQHSFGLCVAHYTRKRRHGSPTGGGPDYAEAQRFLEEHKNYPGNECLLWPFARGLKGDGVVWFRDHQTSTNYAMCCLAHGEPPTPKHEAAHSCGRGHDACVNPNHLRWATRQENHADKLIHGTHHRGEQGPSAKLTIAEVREIRKLRGTVRQRILAERFGVTVGAIHSIQVRKNWSWLP